MLVDTDVLIDYLRGHELAGTFVEAHADTLHVSSISVAELYQGMREGRERIQLTDFLDALTVLPVTSGIAETAGLFRRDHRAQLGCGLADCLIAATALHHQLPLATLNEKHFRMLDDVKVPYLKT